MKVAILSTVYKNHYLKFLNISKSHKDRKGFINNFLEHSSSHLFYWKTYLLKYGFTVEYFATGMSHVNFYWNKINSNSENNMSEDHIVLKQVMLYKPDILFVLSPCYYLKYLNSIRTQVPSIKKLVAWYGADQGNEKQTFSIF